MLLKGGVSTPNPHLTALNPHLDVAAYPVMFTNVTWRKEIQRGSGDGPGMRELGWTGCLLFLEHETTDGRINFLCSIRLHFGQRGLMALFV